MNARTKLGELEPNEFYEYDNEEQPGAPSAFLSQSEKKGEVARIIQNNASHPAVKGNPLIQNSIYPSVDNSILHIKIILEQSEYKLILKGSDTIGRLKESFGDLIPSYKCKDLAVVNHFYYFRIGSVLLLDDNRTLSGVGIKNNQIIYAHHKAIQQQQVPYHCV